MSGLIFVLSLFLVFAIASALGWTADSREEGDWSPTVGGFRQHR